MSFFLSLILNTCIFREMKDLKETLNGLSAECVLEIGCGQGDFLKGLADALPSTKMFVGVDIVDPGTTVPAELLDLPEFEWVEAWGHDLSFPDDSFDFVSIAHVLHHLAPDFIDLTLAEMKRVLCPGGTFLIYEMYNDNQTEAQMSHVFYHHWLAEIDRICGVHHYETFTRGGADEYDRIVRIEKYPSGRLQRGLHP